MPDENKCDLLIKLQILNEFSVFICVHHVINFRKGQDLQYKKIATFFHRMKVAIENEIRKAKLIKVI